MAELPRQSTAGTITGANTAARELALAAAAAISKHEDVTHVGQCRRIDRAQFAFDVEIGTRSARVVVSADG